ACWINIDDSPSPRTEAPGLSLIVSTRYLPAGTKTGMPLATAAVNAGVLSFSPFGSAPQSRTEISPGAALLGAALASRRGSTSAPIATLNARRETVRSKLGDSMFVSLQNVKVRWQVSYAAPCTTATIPGRRAAIRQRADWQAKCPGSATDRARAAWR